MRPKGKVSAFAKCNNYFGLLAKKDAEIVALNIDSIRRTCGS